MQSDLEMVREASRYFRKMDRKYGPHCSPSPLPEIEHVEMPAFPPSVKRVEGTCCYLPDGSPATLEEWATMFESAFKTVARTRMYRRGHLIEVSTIFLGTDHAWDNGPPVLWETMVFHQKTGRKNRPGGHEQWRYRSAEAARAGHWAIVQQLRQTKRERDSRPWPMRGAVS